MHHSLLAIVVAALAFTQSSLIGGNLEKTKQLIAVLKSDATFYEKARACQQLGEFGTKEAIPTLAGLLADEHLNAYARSGLEGIPDAEAAEALRSALSTLKGRQLAGVINSVGVLRDAKAVKLLIPLATDSKSEVSKEALLALGRIGNDNAIQTLRKVLTDGPESTRLDAASACLLAAEKQLVDGQPEIATALYDALRQIQLPPAYRSGAVRGAILARKQNGPAFLIEQLRSEDPLIRNAALITIREIRSERLASLLNVELEKANPELQLQLLAALEDCNNADTLQAIQAKIAGQNPAIRKAALKVLGKIGGPEATEILLQTISSNRSPDETALALEFLGRMEGPSVNEVISKTLSAEKNPSTIRLLIRLVEGRGMTNSVSALLKLASNPDPKVSLDAVGALKTLAGPQEVPALIALIKLAQDDSVRASIESTLTSACSQNDKQDAGKEMVLAELKQATRVSNKASWIRVLTSLGYAKALPEIKQTMNNPNEMVAATAIEQLGQWPDASTATDLLAFRDQTENPNLRKLALTSAIRQAVTATEEVQGANDIILGWLLRAGKFAQSIDDKRLIISGLGRLKQMGSATALSTYLDDPNLNAEASMAIVQIAPSLTNLPGNQELKPILEKVSTTAKDPKIREKAAKTAKAIQSNPAQSLFDGSTLNGWEGNTQVWRVKDGAIVGGSMNGNPQNEFLATTKPSANFLLRLEYKIVGTEGFINGGVQFRSVRTKQPPNEMSGYQADIGAGYSGCLYDESRRNKFLVQAPANQIKRLEKVGDWNRLEVDCRGSRIQIFLNGERTVDYTEADTAIPQSGLIALQIHGGCKAEISFRNLTIQ